MLPVDTARPSKLTIKDEVYMMYNMSICVPESEQ
jgi:hypothetical protein